jgi:hypothetical protein
MVSFFILYLAFMSPLRDTLSVLYGFRFRSASVPFGLCPSVPFSVLLFLCRHAWRSVFLKRSEVLYACLPFLGRKEKEESESPIMVWHCRSAAACVEAKRKKKGKQAVTGQTGWYGSVLLCFFPDSLIKKNCRENALCIYTTQRIFLTF